MKDLLNIATAEIGGKEISGKAANPRILEYVKQSGFNYINNDETPLCSVFMNWVAKKASLESSGKTNACFWLNVGLPVSEPEPGDIVVYWRDWPNSYKGHVGICLGYSKGKTRIYTLGGNQGDMVKESAYFSFQVFGFRRLCPTRKMKFRIGLKFGDTGPEMVEFQDALKLIDMEPDTSV